MVLDYHETAIATRISDTMENSETPTAWYDGVIMDYYIRIQVQRSLREATPGRNSNAAS